MNKGSADAPRKLKFAPKIPTRKQPKPTIVKTESIVSKDDIIDKELLEKVNNAKFQDDFGRKFKAEKKAAVAQVTFGYGNTSTQARSFGTLISKTNSEDAYGLVSQPKEYVEPWDYVRSQYPVTLPLRRPYSGDPEILDRLEFGEGVSGHMPINENGINAEQQLGLMGTGNDPKLIFLQFPTCLPLAKPLDEGRGPADNKAVNASTMPCNLKDLPAGLMGKLLVYRSGKVKMKLGDVLFDVSPGTDQVFFEEVVAVNVKEKSYSVIGELYKHAVVTPDVDSLLDDLDTSDGLHRLIDD